MRILIIRHGESEADLLNVCEGRADFNLTQKGHMQSESMSFWIKDRYTVDKIYCSPLKRAYQTALYLSELFNLPLNIDEQLMEFNNGLIAGLARDDANEKYPFVANLPIHMVRNQSWSFVIERIVYYRRYFPGMNQTVQSLLFLTEV